MHASLSNSQILASKSLISSSFDFLMFFTESERFSWQSRDCELFYLRPIKGWDVSLSLANNLKVIQILFFLQV